MLLVTLWKCNNTINHWEANLESSLTHQTTKQGHVMLLWYILHYTSLFNQFNDTVLFKGTMRKMWLEFEFKNI